MGKSTSEDDLKFPVESERKTVVLIGGSEIGKSATGNSIIGANVFDEMRSLAGGTTACQLQRTVLDDGQILDVIDTPGFVGSSIEPEILGKCFDMAMGGIHAFLVVVSIRTDFSAREASAIESLKELFGSKIGDYMIVVSAHGDALLKTSFDDLLDRSCPEPLLRTLKMCGNRCVLFDNVTEDEVKKSQQRKELLCLVDAVVYNNGGIPFTNELFALSPEASEKFYEEAYEEQLKLFIEKSESKLRERTHGLEKQLADEQVARILAEAKAQEVQTKASFEISMLRKNLYRARGEADELRETHRETEAMLMETKEKFKETELNFAETMENFKEMEEMFKVMEQKFKDTKKKSRITEAEVENYEGGYMCTIL